MRNSLIILSMILSVTAFKAQADVSGHLTPRQICESAFGVDSENYFTAEEKVAFISFLRKLHPYYDSDIGIQYTCERLESTIEHKTSLWAPTKSRKWINAFITRMDKLKSLDLNYTDITNLDALVNLKDLYTLSLRDSNVKNIDAIVDLTNIHILILGGTKISNIDALANLTNLEILDISNTNVPNLDALSYLPHLQRVIVAKGQFSKRELSQLPITTVVDEI